MSTIQKQAITQGLTMSDDIIENITYTQVASCSVGKPSIEIRRQSLRAKLEHERAESDRRVQASFITTLRNLFQPDQPG